MSVPVVFRKFKDGEVIALFPTIPAPDTNRPSACEGMTDQGKCYVDTSIVRITKEAEPNEYIKLLTAVVKAGYDVDKIAKRITSVLTDKRIGKIKEAPVKKPVKKGINKKYELQPKVAA